MQSWTCTYERTVLGLPEFAGPIDFTDELRQRLELAVRLTCLTSAMARREALIAPIIFAVCGYENQQLKIEYRVEVSNQLKGSFDYFIPSPQNLLVVEAKNADLGRGFTQLGAELIALDQWTQQDTPILYGAVKTGDSWRFGQFLRPERKILQDTKLYAVPMALETLLSVLLGIIQPQTVAV